MRPFVLLLYVIASINFHFTSAEYLETIAQWSLLDFEFPAYDPAFALNFRSENTVPTGFATIWDRIFVSVPRLRRGVPATLSYVNRAEFATGTNPKLRPYPSWNWHHAGKGSFNCSQLISVYRLRVDPCNRLWVLDAGTDTSIEDFTVVCPPKILIFDLRTDQLVRSYIFPKEVRRPNNLFTNFHIDQSTATTCDNVFVYVTDTANVGIIAYDAGRDRSWRFVHSSMLPHPDHTTYQIGSDTFELFDGIIGFALSEKSGTVYYQPLATDRLFSVPTAALRRGPLQAGESLPVTLVGRKSSQGLALEIEPNSNSIVFSPLTETAIAIWQPSSNNQRIIAYNPETLQFVAEIQSVKQDNDHLWVLSTRFHKFFMQQVDRQDVNIRLMRIRTDAPKHPPIQPYTLSPQIRYSYYNNTLYG